MSEDHKLEQGDVDKAVQKSSLGRSSFWCGFCKDAIPVGRFVLYERQEHIWEHYSRSAKWEDWIDVSGNVSKGCLLKIAA